MQENNDKYTYEEINGKIVSMNVSSEKQKFQKKALTGVILTLTSAISALGIIAIINGRDYIKNGIKSPQNIEQIKEDDVIDKEIKNMTDNYESNYSEVEKYEKIIFFDENVKNIDIVDPYNMPDFVYNENYKYLGTTKLDNVYVFEKEIREVSYDENGNILNTSEWNKTGEFVFFSDNAIPASNVSTRYELVAASNVKNTVQGKENMKNVSSVDDVNFIFVEENRINGEWYSSKPFIASLSNLPRSSENKRYKIIGTSKRDTVFVYEEQKRNVSTTDFENYQIESDWVSTGNYSYSTEPPTDSIDTRYVMVGYQIPNNNGEYPETVTFKNSQYSEKSEKGKLIQLNSENINEQSSSKVR